MTLGEVLENILDDIDESKSDSAIVSKLTRFINRGYKELAKREYLNKIRLTNLTDGRAKLPYDCYRVLHCYNEGIPVSYQLKGEYIYADGESIELQYCYLPEAIKEKEEFETEDCNIEFIVNYAKYLYYLSESLTDEASLFKMEYDKMDIVKKVRGIENIIDVYGVI